MRKSGFAWSVGLLVAALMTALTGYSEIPAGYYNSLNGKTGEQLKTAVFKVINPHITPTSTSSYNTYYTNLKVTFMQTDLYPDSKRWWDMYSDIPFYSPSFSGLNREHSVPKSWWGYDQNNPTPPYVDLNHLYPSEMKANTAKSNYPLGVVRTATFNNGISKVGAPMAGQGGGAANVFEPSDQYKGDFARTYFYMITCYQEGITWKSNYTYMFLNNTYPSLTSWARDMLLDWMRSDPVSQKELDRNEAVYRIQNNRNPFIDFPQLAEYIWGNKVGQPFYVTDTPDIPTGDPALITPTQDMALEFGEVAVGSSVTRKLHFKGENLSGQLSIKIYRGDTDMFSTDYSTIQASAVNSADGYYLNVTYSPTATGEHSARLLISDGGLEGSRGIQLIGQGLEAPVLSAVKALDPTDITADSYTANWEASDDVVDYYIVTLTRYVNGEPAVEELLAEQNFLTINGFGASDTESYAVQSVRLGYRSPMSNVIFVSHTGISGVEEERPLGVEVFPGLIRFTTGIDHPNARVYDISGRLTALIPVVTEGMEITLPYGVYFIVTDLHPTPVKIIVR